MNLLYFAPVPYHSYWQRPHYMVRSLLHDVYDQIIWVNPTITRLPQWSDFSYLNRASSDVVEELKLPELTVLRPGGLPVEPLPLVNCVNDVFFWRKFKADIASLNVGEDWDIGVGRPSRLAAWAVLNLSVRLKFMDVMDDFPAFYSGLSRISMRKSKITLASNCDYLFCSAPSLSEKLRKYAFSAKVKVIPNGYDMGRLPPISDAHPENKIIGFVGTIASWFDWSLVIEMAQALPQVQIKLIGPRMGHIPANLPSNIKLLPACTVDEAIQHCSQFTVGLIPFKNNELTQSVDPIKYYELRALGIPVWSTAFGSMVQRLSGVSVNEIKTGVDWQALWTQASGIHVDHNEIRRFREAHDWSRRFEMMAECLTVDTASARAIA